MLPAATGNTVDESLSGLSAALADAFRSPSPHPPPNWPGPEPTPDLSVPGALERAGVL